MPAATRHAAVLMKVQQPARDSGIEGYLNLCGVHVLEPLSAEQLGEVAEAIVANDSIRELALVGNNLAAMELSCLFVEALS